MDTAGIFLFDGIDLPGYCVLKTAFRYRWSGSGYYGVRPLLCGIRLQRTAGRKESGPESAGIKENPVLQRKSRMGEESAVQLLCGYIKAVQYFFEKVKYHGAIRQGASLARLVGSFAVKNLAESCGVFDPRGSRQMDMQACPLGSLLAGIKILPFLLLIRTV